MSHCKEWDEKSSPQIFKAVKIRATDGIGQYASRRTLFCFVISILVCPVLMASLGWRYMWEVWFLAGVQIAIGLSLFVHVFFYIRRWRLLKHSEYRFRKRKVTFYNPEGKFEHYSFNDYKRKYFRFGVVLEPIGVGQIDDLKSQCIYVWMNPSALKEVTTFYDDETAESWVAIDILRLKPSTGRNEIETGQADDVDDGFR